jgi:integrase
MASLYRRSGGIYYAACCVKGKRTYRSTHTADLDQAKAALVSLRREVAPEGELTPRFSEFKEQYLPYARTNLSPNTLLLYDQAFRAFTRILGDKRMDLYTSFEIERFKSLHLADGVSPAKVNMDYRSLKSFFQTAVKWGVIVKNPLVGVKQIRIPEMRPVFLSKEEFSTLIASIRQEWFRDLVIFAVMTMMREAEIVNLSWESVDLKNRVIQVENKSNFSTKSRRRRIIPMNEWVSKFLASKMERSGYIFRFPDGRVVNAHYVSKRFKEYVKASGLRQEIHFHTLRHTGASWLVQSGASIYAVQRLLGHSNISVTMGYAHLVTDELHSVVNSLSGFAIAR